MAEHENSTQHDVRHQSRLLRETLNSDKRRVGFVIGAGCPLGIYDEADAKSIGLIPDVAGLTNAVATALQEPRHKECWAKIIEACRGPSVKEPNVEHVLTQLRTICSLRGGGQVDGMSTEDLRALDKQICELIAVVVGTPLPKHRCSYHRFAAWLRHIERAEPVEIFTPNYDLLLEQALELHQIPYFDGFVGSREPFFDLLSMEVDAIPNRWTRLWKLHGSINWVKRDDETVFRKHPASASERLLIYPSHLKYEQSRRMPYLGMLDRFRAFFHHGHSALVICGYSFADDHLNEVLLDGLRSNRSVHCSALMFGKVEECGTAVNHAQRNPNLSVLCADGAVVGTKLGAYKELEEEVPFNAGYIKRDDGATFSQFGDFHHFCSFLETQFGVHREALSDASTNK